APFTKISAEKALTHAGASAARRRGYFSRAMKPHRWASSSLQVTVLPRGLRAKLPPHGARRGQYLNIPSPEQRREYFWSHSGYKALFAQLAPPGAWLCAGQTPGNHAIVG